MREFRRKLSRRIRGEEPEFVRGLIGELRRRDERRWIVYELITHHSKTFCPLDRKWFERLGDGVDSCHAVDEFSRILSGPARPDGPFRLAADEANQWLVAVRSFLA